MNNKNALNLCFFGAAADTYNLGVSALFASTISQIAKLAPSTRLVAFDHARGCAKKVLAYDGKAFEYTRCGAFKTQRFWLTESFWSIRQALKFGRLNNSAAQALLSSDAVLDLTAGDSFSDLYGNWRFNACLEPKSIALKLKRPLILLPQTYGPFAQEQNRKRAAEIVSACRLAFARDKNSFETLKDLAGANFDSDRHRLGVDVAFGLEPQKPNNHLPSMLSEWFQNRDKPNIGINISGLIYLKPEQSSLNYGLKAHYPHFLANLLKTFLTTTEARLCLVPHVLAPRGHFESDYEACLKVAEPFVKTYADRLVVLEPKYNASETKWIIGHMDWFCGTRMHSTIAALSSGVPCASISYSAKAAGVFESCAQQDHVADLRTMTEDEIIHLVIKSYHQRAEAKRSLEQELPKVKQTVTWQMSEILKQCRS